MRSMMKTKCIAAVMAATLTLSGCATTGTAKLETVEQRVGQCIAASLAGALVGAVVANNTGSGRADRGILPGLLVAGAACAAWQAFDSQQDKLRVQQAQLEALRTLQPQRVEYIDERNRAKVIQVSDITQVADPRASAAGGTAPADGAEEEAVCYSMATSLSTDGSNPALLKPTYCDDGAGGFTQVG